MSEIKVDTVAEKTSANGVTVDGLNIKDSKLVTANSVITSNITDLNITSGKIANDAVTLAKMASGTDGNIISYDASGNPVAIATGSDGQVLTSTGAGSPPAFETPASATNTPYFYAYLNSNQTFGTTTSTKIAFGHETLDSANGFNVSNHEYTIPSGQGGKWWIFFQVRRAGFAGDRFFADMYSGSTALLSAESNGGSDSYDTTSGAGLFDLAAGDVLKVEAYHTDSGNRSINGQAKSTFFGGYKLIT
jgi:hypothetical protein